MKFNFHSYFGGHYFKMHFCKKYSFHMDDGYIPLVYSVNETLILKPQQMVNKCVKIGNGIYFKLKKLMIFKLPMKYKLNM